MNSVIDLIQNRVSCPKLIAPAPCQGELEQILACAARAPDHARLKPWFYHVIKGQGLTKLGEVFVSTLDDSVSQDKIDKTRHMPLRAPMMIVAVCEPQVVMKVPAIEQVLAVGAAIQNMQIAITALGYGSIWRTGDMAHANKVKHYFNVSEQGEIVGFLYIGTPSKMPVKPLSNIDEHVKYWD